MKLCVAIVRLILAPGLKKNNGDRGSVSGVECAGQSGRWELKNHPHPHPGGLLQREVQVSGPPRKNATHPTRNVSVETHRRPRLSSLS